MSKPTSFRTRTTDDTFNGYRCRELDFCGNETAAELFAAGEAVATFEGMTERLVGGIAVRRGAVVHVFGVTVTTWQT